MAVAQKWIHDVKLVISSHSVDNFNSFLNVLN